MNIEKLNNQLGKHINLFESYNSGIATDGASFAKICTPDAGSVSLMMQKA